MEAISIPIDISREESTQIIEPCELISVKGKLGLWPDA